MRSRKSKSRGSLVRLSNLGWARFYSVETIVTHRIAPPFEIANPRHLEAQASIGVDSVF